MMRECKISSFDGTEIYYSDRGKGLPLVLCDGIGCDGYAWKYILERFSESNRIIHWHYRGHGQSGNPQDYERLTIRDLCRDLDAVLTHAEVPGGVLLGHSMGVQVILETYHMYPGHVRGLVPICGSYGRPLDTLWNSPISRQLFPIVYEMLTRYPRQIETLWRQMVPTELAYQVAIRGSVNANLAQKGDFLPYLEHISRLDIELFVRMLNFMSKHTAGPYLESIAVPVLILAGEHDNFTPPELSAEMQSRIPDAELVIMPEGTHTSPIEHPDLICDSLRRFIEEKI